MTRAELKSRAARWAKGGSATVLPLDDIFDDALREIIRTVHPLELDEFKEYEASDATEFRGQIWSYPLPANAKKPFYVVNNDTRLRSKRLDALVNDYSKANRLVPDDNRPAFYAVAGRAVLVGPGVGGKVVVGYHADDAYVSTDSGQNTGMGLFPDCYFWAMMKGVHSFYADTEAYQVAEARFNGLRNDINDVAAALRRGAGGRAVNW